MDEKLKSLRVGKIIRLRKSLAIILTTEFEDFNTFEPVNVSLTKDNKIIIEQVIE